MSWARAWLGAAALLAVCLVSWRSVAGPSADARRLHDPEMYEYHEALPMCMDVWSNEWCQERRDHEECDDTSVMLKCMGTCGGCCIDEGGRKACDEMISDEVCHVTGVNWNGLHGCLETCGACARSLPVECSFEQTEDACLLDRSSPGQSFSLESWNPKLWTGPRTASHKERFAMLDSSTTSEGDEAWLTSAWGSVGPNHVLTFDYSMYTRDFPEAMGSLLLEILVSHENEGWRPVWSNTDVISGWHTALVEIGEEACEHPDHRRAQAEADDHHDDHMHVLPECMPLRARWRAISGAEDLSDIAVDDIQLHERVCGDGVRTYEYCDDGNTMDGDGCSSTCEVEPHWHCLEGDGGLPPVPGVRRLHAEAAKVWNPDVCKPLVCGDGIVSEGETCDPGPAAAGDGCSDDCQVETGGWCDHIPCGGMYWFGEGGQCPLDSTKPAIGQYISYPGHSTCAEVAEDSYRLVGALKSKCTEAGNCLTGEPYANDVTVKFGFETEHVEGILEVFRHAKYEAHCSQGNLSVTDHHDHQGVQQDYGGTSDNDLATAACKGMGYEYGEAMMHYYYWGYGKYYGYDGTGLDGAVGPKGAWPRGILENMLGCADGKCHWTAATCTEEDGYGPELAYVGCYFPDQCGDGRRADLTPDGFDTDNDGCHTLESEQECVSSADGRDDHMESGSSCHWCCGNGCGVVTGLGAPAEWGVSTKCVSEIQRLGGMDIDGNLAPSTTGDGYEGSNTCGDCVDGAWMSLEGFDCDDYADPGEHGDAAWCKDGGFGPGWDMAWGGFKAFSDADGMHAGHMCCACGGGKPEHGDFPVWDDKFDCSSHDQCQVHGGQKPLCTAAGVCGSCTSKTSIDGMRTPCEGTLPGGRCDDGNMMIGDGCSDKCVVEDGWYCSGGSWTSPDTCVPRVCGDGLRHHTEMCDDGNAASGDGCDSACTVERGYHCDGGSPTSADECVKFGTLKLHPDQPRGAGLVEPVVGSGLLTIMTHHGWSSICEGDVDIPEATVACSTLATTWLELPAGHGWYVQSPGVRQATHAEVDGITQATSFDCLGACEDEHWTSAEGATCDDYVDPENSWCKDGSYGPGWDMAAWGGFESYANADGVHAGQACCACGGVGRPADECKIAHCKSVVHLTCSTDP